MSWWLFNPFQTGFWFAACSSYLAFIKSSKRRTHCRFWNQTDFHCFLGAAVFRIFSVGIKSNHGCTVFHPYKNTENEKQDKNITLTLFIQAIEKQGRDKEGGWRMDFSTGKPSIFWLSWLWHSGHNFSKWHVGHIRFAEKLKSAWKQCSLLLKDTMYFPNFDSFCIQLIFSLVGGILRYTIVSIGETNVVKFHCNSNPYQCIWILFTYNFLSVGGENDEKIPAVFANRRMAGCYLSIQSTASDNDCYWCRKNQGPLWLSFVSIKMT